jgi:hypothetical protein
MGSRNGSNGTPLDPPLFWLDNTFKFFYAMICASSFHFLKDATIAVPQCRLYNVQILGIRLLQEQSGLLPLILVACRYPVLSTG